MTTHRRLTRSGSVFLDLIRFGAACVVFFNHLAYILPAAGRFVHLSHIAVCIFFVLSGFIIRMLVRSRETTMKVFLIDRASRIYSVALPALALAFACWGISEYLHPNNPLVGIEVSPNVDLQIVTNLTFTNSFWGYDHLPNFDSPFWSLGFECIYYLLFALMFFRWKRWRGKALFILLLFAAGPSIVFLAPVWLLGCLLYDVYVWLDGRSYDWMVTSVALIAALGLAFARRHQLSRFLLLTDGVHRSGWLMSVLSPGMRRVFADSTGKVPWLDRASSSYYIAGVFASLAMLWGLVMIDRFYPQISENVARKIRSVAEATFALYLFHLPLVMLCCSLLGSHPRYAGAIGCAIGIFCIVASRGCDELKNAMRHWLQNVFQVPRKAG
jgi:peptidoglycan/LPS O-acetylase OafA/YrhL